MAKRKGKSNSLTPIGEEAIPKVYAAYWAKKEFLFLTPPETDETGSSKQLVNGLVTKHQPCIILGKPETMDGMLMHEVAYGLATAKQVLGNPATNNVNVALMSGKFGRQVTRAYGERYCQAYGLELDNLRNLYVCDRVPQLDNQQHLDELDRFLEFRHIDVLVIDKVNLALPSQSADCIRAQGPLLSPFVQRCNRHRVTLILGYHVSGCRKSMPDLNEIAAEGFTEFAAMWISVSTRQGRRMNYGVRGGPAEPDAGRNQIAKQED